VALTSYAELQTAVGTWLNRSDLTAQIPDFITLAEAKFKRDLAGGTTITALSGGVNWLFTAHPDVYLYGALMEAAPYLHDDARVPIWKGLLAEAVEGVRRSRTSTAYTLTSYAGLQTAIKGWLDRFDVDAIAFITLAEASLARDPRLKRLKSDTFTIDAAEENVPADFHLLQSWYLDGPTYYGPIEIVSADQLSVQKAALGTTGAPRYAAILDGKFRFAPEPDTTYSTKIAYWKTLGSASAGTSWLFTAAPDIYLYASLVEGAPYVGKDPSMWAARLEAEIEKLRLETWETHWSGTMVRRPRAIGG
jgi:hypothetical protein